MAPPLKTEPQYHLKFRLEETTKALSATLGKPAATLDFPWAMILIIAPPIIAFSCYARWIWSTL